jgi:hypothetical protein
MFYVLFECFAYVGACAGAEWPFGEKVNPFSPLQRKAVTAPPVDQSILFKSYLSNR